MSQRQSIILISFIQNDYEYMIMIIRNDEYITSGHLQMSKTTIIHYVNRINSFIQLFRSHSLFLLS